MDRIATRVEALNPELSADEHAAAVDRIGVEEREPRPGEPWLGMTARSQPPKSASARWVLADAAVQAAIVADQAHADVVALMERDVAATGIGHAGFAQVPTRGLMATADATTTHAMAQRRRASGPC